MQIKKYLINFELIKMNWPHPEKTDNIWDTLVLFFEVAS